jgi:hypothetical protein
MAELSIDTADWGMVEAQLPPNWRVLAAQYEVFRSDVPEHLGAKLGDPGVVLRLILHHVVTGTSLKMTMALAATVGLVEASSVALHKKMKKAAPYLWALVQQMVGQPADFCPAPWAGYEVLLVDATVVTRPGATGTTARVHYVLRAADLSLEQVQVSDEKEGETLRWVKARAGQLLLADRVYGNPPGIRSVLCRGADVLVRYNPGTLPLSNEAGEPIQVTDLMQTLKKPGDRGEWTVFCRTRKTPAFSGRLCAVRLSIEKAEEARRRLRREHRADVSPVAWALADFVIVFTTASAERLSTEQVLELYRLRWQVELRIKRDKSLGQMDKLPNFRKDTIASWLSAHVLSQLLISRIASAHVAIPPRALPNVQTSLAA